VLTSPFYTMGHRNGPAVLAAPGAVADWSGVDMPKGTCSIVGCDHSTRTSSAPWCERHYYRWYRYGDPLYVSELHGATVLDRFWFYVQRTERCWVWTGGLVDGYGLLWNGHRQVRAHRWSYEHFIGPIPDGTEPDHLCFNRACVNPADLEAVTRSENMRRSWARRRTLAIPRPGQPPRPDREARR